jgi:hypothetical protein
MDDEKEILPLDNDLSDYISLSNHLKDDTERKKKLISNEIEELGETYIFEIERKRKNKELKQKKLIPYILKYCNEKYSKKELTSYSLEDIQEIYNQIKTERKSPIIKFIEFIFNLE